MRGSISKAWVLCFWTVAACPFLLGVARAQIKPIELLANPGFERVEDARPTDWEVNNAGRLSVDAPARAGVAAAKFQSIEHAWGFCALAAETFTLAPRATYRASVWAKGRGDLEFAVYQYSVGGFIGTRFLKPKLKLTEEWQKLELTYSTDDGRVRKGAMALHLYGSDAVAWLDDASFSFNPEENPRVQLRSETPATRTLRIWAQGTHAAVELFVAGKPVALDNGVGVTEIAEGLVPIAVRATGTGDAPSVQVTVEGHPESNGRWRVGTTQADGWLSADFDDTRWSVVTPGPEGGTWSVDPGSREVFLRQVLLWNATHYGPNRCIMPPMTTWGFPRNGLETLTLALYSPLALRLDDYEFTLDVPAEFVLLNKTDYQPRWIMNNPACELRTESLARRGRQYTRYHLSHRGKELAPGKTQLSLLPLKMARPVAFDRCRFYFRRSARGNFTELEQSIPIEILPRVNGRRPKKIRISQYAPMGYSTLAKEHLTERIAQDVAAGCSSYTVGFSPGWGEMWRGYMRLFHDTVCASGAEIVLWMNYPLNYGGVQKGHLEWYPSWLPAHPEAHGVYYEGTPVWGDHPNQRPYCNTYVTSAAGAGFWEIVTKEYARALTFYPHAQMFFSDWEFHNVTKDGKGVHCFCARCKAAFAEHSGLPGVGEMSDTTIMDEHRDKWLAFRNHQDGQIQGRMADTVHALGRKYMTYSWAGNDGFWAACRGKLDAAFAGMPGNSTADSYFQKVLDENAAAFRTRTGMQQFVGQRFVFFRDVRREEAWKPMVLSHDGLVHPNSWKSQVLRVVAATRGGVDLQNSLEFSGGIRYYLGEATRLISTLEHLFWDGERQDALAASAQIAYPNLLVLRLNRERLVLLFNESPDPLEVRLQNRELAPKQVAVIWGTDTELKSPAEMALTVPGEDVAAVHIR
ncbi:MAG: hypothetical protein HN742_39575 [Lentisphaerae bacterium]|nr:hypothetical protein [Lentisphaerota bacterium]MBT5612455.1 hypothetical protein [Lentisphaerota bacterium]MBT7057161.1 hypothetical protein [Lentisphaerota bacterium]MBT7848035.1 hypothetical protein [Lentisphaerota bacterium]